MGSTSNKQQQHEQRANQACNEGLHHLHKAQHISGRLYQLTKDIYQHCMQQQFDKLTNDFTTLSYSLPNVPLPLCLKNTRTYYLCRTCYDEDVSICEGCFQVHKHANHNYQLMETSYHKICSCGNHQVFADPPSCYVHRLNQPIIQSQNVQLFRSQIKYLIQLALPAQTLFKISEEFRNTLVFHLLTFIHELVQSNNSTASLLEEILFTVCQLSSEHFTLFQELVCNEKESKNTAIITHIVQAIIKSTCKKDRLTKVYFNLIFNNHPKSIDILKIFKDCDFKPSSFPKTYQQYFDRPLNCRVYIQPLDQQKLDCVYQKHEKLAYEMGKILLHNNCSKILMQIFQKTKFTELLNFQNYYLANNQANSNINKINLHFSLIAFKIVRILAETAEGKNLLLINLPDIYQKITNKIIVTFDHSLERVFSLIVFCLMNYQVPTKVQLQQLVGTSIQKATANTLLIQNIDFKNSFVDQYNDLIIKSSFPTLQGKISFALAELVATDELFIKIVSNCVSEDHIFREYIEQRLGQVLRLDELSSKNVRQPLRKLPELFKYFEVPLQNNMAQLILTANSNQKGQQSEIILYNLLIAWENILSAKFKAIADQFITQEQKVVDFIKNYTVIENKKIKLKANNNLPLLSLSPDSQFFFENLENEVIQKLVQNKLNKTEASQNYKRLFCGKSLKQSLQIWQKCASILQGGTFDTKKNQRELISTLLTLCNLYFGTRSPEVKQVIQRFANKFSTSNSKVQIYLKYILASKNIEEKDKQKQSSEKKKQMLNALKEKQKNALKNFKMQEKCNIDLQCIFCKNSIEGEPYLLGHFKYNNFYSQKILEVNTPFMEFTTCGHSAHEKCLIEMHKGDFRIWYPCILCKSITNILLPIANAQLNQEKRLEKILDFLKNFAANYTFFFESNKQLVQFDLNDIIGVYKLLFKTMAYSLTIYPIANFSYFQRSQLPILKFIFDLLVFSCKKLRNLSFGGQYLDLKANNDFTNIFNYHKYQLQALITGNQTLQMQRKIDLHRDRIHEDLTPLFDQIYEYLNDERGSIDYEPKQTVFKDAVKVSIFRPPQDLIQLRKKKLSCSCSNLSQTFQICILCEWACCSHCKDMRKVHALQMHLGETVFISCFNGKYTYIHEQLTGEFSSIYADYLGHQANDKKLIVAQEYTLSESGWAKIVNDVICNRLHKEIMRVHS